MENLIATIKTVEDRDRVYSEIELVAKAIYKEGELEKVLTTGVSMAFAEYIGAIPPVGQAEIVDAKLSELKKALGELVVVKLTLAFEPSEATIEKILGFLRENLDQKLIIEIRYEPKILGGVILEFKGLYRDYTLKTRLDEIFKNKREEIFKI